MRAFSAARKLVFFVKQEHEGDVTDIAVKATAGTLVGELKDVIIAKLRSTERPIALELVAVAKGADGKEEHRVLNTHKTVGEEGLTSRTTIYTRLTAAEAAKAAQAKLASSSSHRPRDPGSAYAAPPLLVPSAAGEALRAAMLATEPVPIEGCTSGERLLKLPASVAWPQLGAEPLFVRHFYDDCYEGAMESLPPGSHFIIHGDSGSEFPHPWSALCADFMTLPLCRSGWGLLTPQLASCSLRNHSNFNLL